VPHPYRETDAHFFLNTVVPNEWVWAITLRQSRELVGMVGLTPESDPDTAELGYYVARNHWGNGIATEAAQLVIHHGIHSLGLRRIRSGHFVDNPASGRVLSKLGGNRTFRAPMSRDRFGPALCRSLSGSVHLEESAQRPIKVALG
jgi:RimJ/RimL family protein N-acetyltransferase